MLEALYQKILDQGLGEVLFHDGTVTSASEFIALVRGPGVIFFIIVDVETRSTVAIWWLNRVTRTHAWCHFCAFKEIWGSEDTVPLGKEAMRICLKDLEFTVILGMLPSWNQFAIEYIKAVGLKEIGEVPGLLWSDKKQVPIPGKIFAITREDL